MRQAVLPFGVVVDLAAYTAPNGNTVYATRLTDQTVVDNVGTTGKAGEWLLFIDGRPNLCVDAAFTSQFTQKFPCAVDAEPEPLPQNGPMVA